MENQLDEKCLGHANLLCIVGPSWLRTFRILHRWHLTVCGNESFQALKKIDESN
jgi:hypothetical protein